MDGSTLRFASEELWSDKEVVIEAVRQDDGSALRFASEVVWSDKEVVIEAVRMMAVCCELLLKNWGVTRRWS